MPAAPHVSKNKSLRKCTRWWKTLFFHMVDIAIVNYFILFQLHRVNNPDIPDLKRPKKVLHHRIPRGTCTIAK
jgi:hypothetical protein